MTNPWVRPLRSCIAWNLVSSFLRTRAAATWSGGAVAGLMFASEIAPIRSSGVRRPLLRTAIRKGELRRGRRALVGTADSGPMDGRCRSAETVVHSKLRRCENVTKGRDQNWSGARMIALGEIFTPGRSTYRHFKFPGLPQRNGRVGSGTEFAPLREPA